MQGAQIATPEQDSLIAGYDADLEVLAGAKDRWARTSIDERLRLLGAARDATMQVAEAWAEASARGKGIDPASPLVGEEWLAGPYATLLGIDGFRQTLSQMTDKAFLDDLPVRTLPNGQTAVGVLPHSTWDKLLLSGVTAEVWMEPGVAASDLKADAASAYDIPVEERTGVVALVLGAGNIAAIPPTDVLYKLLVENQVVLLKMNPINDYLTDHFRQALAPFIEADVLRIVSGDARGGAYLCDHPLVEELHVTGSEATHDAIVWGPGEEGVANKAAGTPKNTRRFSSELGNVSPTIVVPGPWSKADIRFQAENLATMKLHNAGHNCVALQTIVMPRGWEHGADLLREFKRVVAETRRPSWYPGADDRVDTFKDHGGDVDVIDRGPDSPPLVMGEISPDDFNSSCEVFGHALGVTEMDAPDPETYLREAIAHANDHLHGTLGASVLIHPRTADQIGRDRFEEILADLHYGTVAVNAWSALAFLLPMCPWGAFPGHTLDDIGSGVGIVHNAFMLERVERVVVEAPWRPFPRGVASGQFTLLPRPPFFVTNRRQHVIGRLLTEFQYEPGWRKLPRIFANALRG